jgi:hypothetical protein
MVGSAVNCNFKIRCIFADNESALLGGIGPAMGSGEGIGAFMDCIVVKSNLGQNAMQFHVPSLQESGKVNIMRLI